MPAADYATLARLALPVPPPRPPGPATPWLLEQAARHNVLPAVVRHLGHPAPPELVRAAGFTVLLRLRLAEISAALHAAGVPVIVLKGAEFADRLYPDPALRGFTDLDLLVPRAAVLAAGEVLRALGYRLKELHGLAHAAPYGEQLWVPASGPAFGVEIHWNLVNSPAVQRGVSVVFEDLQRGADGRVSPAALLLIAAVHGAVSHQFDRLGLVVDAHQAAALPLDAAYLADATARTGARLAVVTALSLVERLWGVAPAVRLPGRPVDALAQRLITPATVLRPATRRADVRRRLFRELLKRR